MEQKIIITKNEVKVNDLLSEGWKVVSVTAQHITNYEFTSSHETKGSFCFVLERSAKKD